MRSRTDLSHAPSPPLFRARSYLPQPPPLLPPPSRLPLS